MNVYPQDKPMGTLVTDALQQLSRLVRGEVALACAEVTQSFQTAAAGLGLVLASAIMAITALNTLSAALVAAVIAMGVPAGWAALGVGAAFAVIAICLGVAGARALKPSGLIPTRTVGSLRRDVETIKEIVTNDPSQ